MPLAQLVDPFKQVFKRDLSPFVVAEYGKIFFFKVNSLLVNDEETNGSGGEMEEAVEEEIEVFHVFLSKMKIEILVCQLDFEQPAHVKVANVTRAGCEKASTGQFELLR